MTKTKPKKVRVKMPEPTGIISALIDMIFQHCHIEERKTIYIIDNECLSANEKATALLARIGIFRDKNGRMYSVTKKMLTKYWI